MPLQAKPAKNVQEAPTQAPKVCLPKASVQNAHQAKQVAQLVKVQKLPDVLNVTRENTPKNQAKQVAKIVRKALRPKALRIAVRARQDPF